MLSLLFFTGLYLRKADDELHMAQNTTLFVPNHCPLSNLIILASYKGNLDLTDLD